MGLNTDENGNFTLFDLEDKDRNSESGNKIDVVKMDFVSADSIYWQDLFSGYDKLLVITFSSGINFAYKLVNMFSYAEVIFGNDMVMSETASNIIAYQSTLIKEMRKAMSGTLHEIYDRIDNGTLRFYVSEQKSSHEKIYLLSAEDGRKRVITGSANMSFNAFNGIQRENICCIDGDEAYEFYYGKYLEFRDICTDSITKRALEVADAEENIDELPISGSARVKKAIVIDPVKGDSDEIEFTLDVHNLSRKISPSIPKTENKGKIVISPDIIKRTKHQIIEQKKQDSVIQNDYPELVVEIESASASLNNKKLDLNPSGESIKNDVSLFLTYMNGFEKFHGDYESLQCRYYEFANWFFCSPFMAPLRDIAIRYNQTTQAYPVFGLLYGQSKAGKTTFLETLLKMMIGQKPKLMASDFTKKTIEALKQQAKGAPIIVDDMVQQRFKNHAEEMIKSDSFGIREHLTNYPAVVISANEDVKSVAQEIIRRTVICHVDAGLTNIEIIQSNLVRQVQSKIGTAFYREYLRRMLEVLPDSINELKNDECEKAPDILKISSEILIDILSEYSDSELPGFIRTLSVEDYFGEQVTGKQVIKAVKNAWRINRKEFAINKKINELRFNVGDMYEAARLIKELPETLEAKRTRDCIVMKLDVATEYFGINFSKKHLFHQ